MMKRWRLWTSPWSSTQALPKPISPRVLICSGMGERLKPKPFSIARPCSAHATAIFGASITCVPGRTSRWGNMTTRQANVTYQGFAALAASLGLVGERAKAEAAAAELLRRKPNYSAETARQEFFFCNDPGFVNRFVEGLRVAGISGV